MLATQKALQKVRYDWEANRGQCLLRKTTKGLNTVLASFTISMRVKSLEHITVDSIDSWLNGMAVVNQTLLTTNLDEGTVARTYRNIVEETTAQVLAGNKAIIQVVAEMMQEESAIAKYKKQVKFRLAKVAQFVDQNGLTRRYDERG